MEQMKASILRRAEAISDDELDSISDDASFLGLEAKVSLRAVEMLLLRAEDKDSGLFSRIGVAVLPRTETTLLPAYVWEYEDFAATQRD